MRIQLVKSRVIFYIAFLTLFLSFQIKFPDVLASASVNGNERFEIICQEGQNINISNMAPGDSHTKKYTLKNKLSSSTDVLLDLKKISCSEHDLFHQLKLTLIYDGNQIYHGIMSGFKATTLSQVPGNSEKILEIIQELPGEETGNEFENAVLESEFIFRLGDTSKVLSAISSTHNNIVNSSNNILPKTGSTGHTIFWAAGSAFIGIGLFIRNKKKWT